MCSVLSRYRMLTPSVVRSWSCFSTFISRSFWQVTLFSRIRYETAGHTSTPLWLNKTGIGVYETTRPRRYRACKGAGWQLQGNRCGGGGCLKLSWLSIRCADCCVSVKRSIRSTKIPLHSWRQPDVAVGIILLAVTTRDGLAGTESRRWAKLIARNSFMYFLQFDHVHPRLSSLAGWKHEVSQNYVSQNHACILGALENRLAIYVAIFTLAVRCTDMRVCLISNVSSLCFTQEYQPCMLRKKTDPLIQTVAA